MPSKYPPLTPAEVRAILSRKGFQQVRGGGSHEQWEHANVGGQRRLVTVDAAERDFGVKLMKTMISQSGLTREEFYGATPGTGRKIGTKRARGRDRS